ncbi:MAG: glutathione S-transferase family protein [Deltaproteobacteria bacterium]
MKLYHLPYSHHCAKVRITLIEKGIAHELPPLPGGSTQSPEFLAQNPLGKVPLLVDGDLALAESEVIVEYLEETCPEPAMLPRGAADRARSRWLSRFHDLYFGKQLSALYVALNQGRRDDPAMTAEVNELFRLTDVLETSIRPAPFFFGASFGIADASFALSVLYLKMLTEAYGRPLPAERAPRLMAWFEAVSLRPSVALVIADCKTALGQA